MALDMSFFLPLTLQSASRGLRPEVNFFRTAHTIFLCLEVVAPLPFHAVAQLLRLPVEGGVEGMLMLITI